MEINDDFAQLVRLALSEQTEDVRLFVARLVRKYRSIKPDLAEKLDLYLRSKPARAGAPMRKASNKLISSGQPLPVDDESRLSLLKVFVDNPDVPKPLLSEELVETFEQLIQERRQLERLSSLGLSPTRSAIFLGQPGVGKTLTARWLAAHLGVPLYVLDLTAVMSSLLGKTGTNLRSALDFAKQTPCVLLLDEFDAIAKRRSDDSDIGELKRLVTVMLQEVDEWPATGLLLAATNHPELIDPALWRRFDLVVDFKLPDQRATKEAVMRFLGADLSALKVWVDILAMSFKGESFSGIERSIQRFRRALALGTAPEAELIEDFIKLRVAVLDHQSRLDLALLLSKQTKLFSQHRVSNITGISRDTIRKYGSGDTSTKRRSKQ